MDNVNNNITNNKIKKKNINNEDILNLNILTSYHIDYENDEKKHIKNIFGELIQIKEIFNKNDTIEILKIFAYKNKNDFKSVISIFTSIFKIMNEEYINNYEYLLIIFELLKLYKNKNNILESTKNKNINLSNFYTSLKSYLILLSTKSYLIKLLLLLDKTNITVIDLKLLFNMLSKELSNYITFDSAYNKLFECIDINEFNTNFINEYKQNSKKYYNDTYRNLNEIYDFNDLNKYKVNESIIQYFNKILKSITKIKNIE